MGFSLHLIVFHVYLTYQNLSTYEYLILRRRKETVQVRPLANPSIKLPEHNCTNVANEKVVDSTERPNL